MAFVLPAESTDTATLLRELEQNCPKTTPKDVRAALITAAKELEDWAKLAETIARELDEAANVRISQMASLSRVEEIQRGIRVSIMSMAARLRELA